MNPQSLANHLEEQLRLEISAKQALIECIEAQECALRVQDPEAFTAAVARTEQELVQGRGRTKRREELLEGLAHTWGVPVNTLTLGGVARRLGAGGQALEALRLDLRQAVAGVIRRNRRLAALIGLHRRINTEICQLVLGCDSPEQVEDGGALVNAEA